MLSKNVDLNNTVILVTGAAGFVGANLVMNLAKIIRIYGFLKKGILQISSLLMKFLLSINHKL